MTEYSSNATIGRRHFLYGAALLYGMTMAPAMAGEKKTYAFVGTYTDHGKGIQTFAVDETTGTLTPIRDIMVPNPSALALSPDRKFLYAVNEIDNFEGQKSGSVTAFSVDPATAALTLLNVVASEGATPTYISVDPSGKFVFAANYHGGSYVVLPIESDGKLGAVSDRQVITGPLGLNQAVDGPPGNLNNAGHDMPHAHMISPDPSGNFLLGADTGTDRIYIYRLDRTSGKLVPNEPAFVQTSAGAGPRHFAFHPNGRYFYAINEEASTVNFMIYDRTHGAFDIRQSLSTLPAGYRGSNDASEIAVSPNGRVLYAANRRHDSIARYTIAEDGRLRYRSEEWTRGSYPRKFAIDPSGRFMYVLHSRSDNITIFRVKPSTGEITFTGQYCAVGNPSDIVFLTI